jgi:hypothetical protein
LFIFSSTEDSVNTSHDTAAEQPSSEHVGDVSEAAGTESQDDDVGHDEHEHDPAFMTQDISLSQMDASQAPPAAEEGREKVNSLTIYLL